jgi:HK97 family phage portal protein
VTPAITNEARDTSGFLLSAWRAQREAARAGATAEVRNDVIMSSDPRMLDLFGASTAPSGMAVTATSAMRVAAAYACTTKISGAIATMLCDVYARQPGGQRERIEDDPLWWLLNEQPSARYTAVSHWEHAVGSFLLRGDGFSQIARKNLGGVKEFIPWYHEGVTVQKYKDADRLKYFYSDGISRPIGLDQDDVLHFTNFGFNGLRSMSQIQWAARNAIGNAMAMDEYSGRFFAGGAHPSIVLESKGKMTNDGIAQLQQAFQAKYSGPDNFHRLPLVLTQGITAKELSLSAEDAQLLEARKFQVIDIARAFGVPPHMIGETSANTSWGTGIEAMGRGFVTYTLNTHLKRMEQELNRKLFRTAGRFVEFDRGALLQGDSKAQAEWYRAAIGGPGTGPGWMTQNQIRRALNLPPEAGDADKLFDPRDVKAATPPTKGKTNEEAVPAAA